MTENPDTHEKLPSIIDRGSYRLTLRDRVGDVALYERWNRDLGRTSTFEVVRIRRAPAGEVFGRPQPAREVYPSTSEWGQYGWTYQHEINALRKFETLVAAQGRDAVVEDLAALAQAA